MFKKTCYFNAPEKNMVLQWAVIRQTDKPCDMSKKHDHLMVHVQKHRFNMGNVQKCVFQWFLLELISGDLSLQASHGDGVHGHQERELHEDGCCRNVDG